MTNPKQINMQTMYPYYAGYSKCFVEHIIDKLKIEPNQTILDPWNGSGTTTLVSFEKSINSYGYDINPVVQYIARAKILSNSNIDLINLHTKNIVVNFRKKIKYKTKQTDLLLRWFTTKSVTDIRRLEFIIVKEFNIDCEDMPILDFFYVALFRVLHKSLKKIKSSNPTWIKQKIRDADKISLKKVDISTMFTESVSEMIRSLPDFKGYIDNKPIIGISSSTNIPLSKGAVDAIITSPPYCTRIDYVIATSPELALLKFTADDLKNLRNKMIGTPTIIEKQFNIVDAWGATCTALLKNIAKHNSKAACTYYLKHYLQYFHFLHLSIRELDRVLKLNGYCVIVVQGSYFKDLYIDLPLIIQEMTLEYSWALKDSYKFTQSNSLSKVNATSKKYRNNKTDTTETVLILKKES